MTRIGFIGGGQMANAMIGGLISSGTNPSSILVSEPWEVNRSKLSSTYNVPVTTSNADVIHCNVLIFAVKPQVIKSVALELKSILKPGTLVISIAAGITVNALNEWLGNVAIVRVMPNTPALVQEGATGAYASPLVTPSQWTLANDILTSISKKLYWVTSEALIDVVTGVSGSGPAYFFLLVECLESAGVALGLPLDVARGLASQTCLGAGAMLKDGQDPSVLRKNVTSPNGTTEAAIKSLEGSGIREAFMSAVKAASERGAELGRDSQKVFLNESSRLLVFEGLIVDH